MTRAPALKAFILLVAGIGLSRWLSPSLAMSLWLTGCILCLWLIAPKWAKPLERMLPPLAIVALGLLRATVSECPVSPRDVVRLPDSLFCRIEGVILADPVIASTHLVFPLSINALWTGDTLLSPRGRIWVRLRPAPPETLHAGDRIWITGLLTIPPGRWNPAGFDQRAFLARQGIHRILESGRLERIDRGKGPPLWRGFFSPARREIGRRIDRLYPETSRGLIRTLLLADRSGLEEEVQEAFARMGVVHLLAVSGLHVGFVLLFLRLLLGLFPLSRRVRSLGLLLGLAGFAALTGAKPPVLRAVLMAGLYIIGLEIGRKVSLLQTTAAVAFFLLVFRPAYLNDLGFLLSFSAVFAMILLTPSLSELVNRIGWIQTIQKRRLGSATVSLLLATLAAQLGTLPFVLFHFYRFSLSGLLFNLIAIPLSGLIVVWGWSSVLLSFFFSPAGEALAVSTHLLVRFLIWITALGASFPGVSVWIGRPPVPVLVLYGIALFILHVPNPTAKKKLLFLSLSLLNLGIWTPVFSRRPPPLLYYQLDVGQGDAALIRLPNGEILIIDGGPASESYDAGERVILPLLRQWGCSRIDRIILTHPHADHVGGLVTLANHLSVRRVLLAGSAGGDSAYAVFLEVLRRKHVPVQIVNPPDSLLFPGVRIDFLSPDTAFKRRASVNDQSLVALLTYGQVRILFMGDAEVQVEERLLRRYRHLRADILKVGHHGSRRGSTRVFLDSLAPRYAVLSVGRNNRHGHPSRETLLRLQDAGVPFFRTDRDGAIQMVTDGKTITMTTERAHWVRSAQDRNPSRTFLIPATQVQAVLTPGGLPADTQSISSRKERQGF